MEMTGRVWVFESYEKSNQWPETCVVVRADKEWWCMGWVFAGGLYGPGELHHGKWPCTTVVLSKEQAITTTYYRPRPAAATVVKRIAHLSLSLYFHCESQPSLGKAMYEDKKLKSFNSIEKTEG